MTRGSPFFCGTLTGVISASNTPLRCATIARACEASAMRSCASRVMPNSAATFSAVSGIESMPWRSFISLLTKRQPMVVSSIFALRENALSALPITKGARDMLSTPPAIISSASPLRMARAALPSASSPEPHSRCTVEPGTCSGKPASSALMRATVRSTSS